MKKGNYFFTGIMFIGFAIMVFGISYYRYTKQSYYEYININQKIKAEVIKISPVATKDFSYYLSLPFAVVEYGSLDLAYCRPIVTYENYKKLPASFKNPFPVTIPNGLDSLEILYSPADDREIIDDTFYLRGGLWFGSIISSFLLLIGLYSLKI